MDSTTSPHCIPSPPIFSLDVRNLGHLCFEELPEAATAVEEKAKHLSITHNQLHQSDKKSQPKTAAPPVTFLPINQSDNEANRNSDVDEYPHPSAGDDDIFDEIFTTFEDVLGDDQPGRKPSISVLYPSVGLGHNTLTDGSTTQHNHSDPYAPMPLDSSSESGSGHTTVDSAQSTSPAAHMYEDPQCDGNVYSQINDNRAPNEGGEVGSESLKSCLQTLHQHHNSHEKSGVTDAMEGFISKFGKLKPQTVDSREQILARAAILAQQSSKQPKEEIDSTPPCDDSSQHEGREQPINRSDELTTVGGKSVKLPDGATSEDPKRARTQPLTPALLVDTLPLSSKSSTQDAPDSFQKVKCADAMAGVQPASSNTSTRTAKDFSDIPIAARALPLLPTSLESFRSQLSKSKKNTAAKKKQLPVSAKSSAAKAPSTASPGSSAGMATNGKKATTTSKNTSQVQKNKKSKVQTSVPSSASTRSSEYNLSEYFSSDEISGLLSVICSDDECEGERDGSADVASRTTDHVMLSPHVKSGGAFFSFGTGDYGASSNNVSNIPTSSGSGSGGGRAGSTASMISVPADKSVRKRKVDAESVANPVVKKSTGSPATASRPTSRSSATTSSSTYVHTPLSAATRKADSPHTAMSNQNYLSKGQFSGCSTSAKYDSSLGMNVDGGEHMRRAATQGHTGRDSYALSLEMQRKIAEDSEKVLRMQTDKILQDNHQRQQRHQGVGAVDSVPSLLSSLGSVGGSNTHLQGLAGLSSVLQGGGSGIPSLISMYASAGSSSLPTSSPVAGVSPGFVQSGPSPHPSLTQSLARVQAVAPSQIYSSPHSIAPPTLLGGMQQHPQQQAQYSSSSQMYQVNSSPQQYQHQHQHFK